jgi:hypothetical protein
LCLPLLWLLLLWLLLLWLLLLLLRKCGQRKQKNQCRRVAAKQFLMAARFRACIRSAHRCHSSHHQNLNRSVVWIRRISSAFLGKPNCALLTMVFQLLNVTWFKTFVASTRKSML